MNKLKQTARKLKQDLPALALALKDPAMPLVAKLLAAITVAYALSPVDLVPDFIPVLGYLDDLLILPALAALTCKLIPAEVWDRCRKASAGVWAGGKPKKWYYAIPVVIFWLLLLFVIYKSFFSR